MAKKILELKNVSKKFQRGGEISVALDKANVVVCAGEFIAIIGPSGSGKSTFLTIAGALQNPTSGKVLINGENIRDFSKAKLSKLRLNEIGFILQASNLVPYLTVRDQLRFVDIVAKRKTQPKKVRELLESLSVGHLARKYPADLSGGERQRVAIAKVLHGSSQLILADEPTASLDSQKAFDVVKLLAKETHERKKATIMVTHDTRLIDFCDKVYEMKDGVLTEKNREKTKKTK